MHVIYIASPYRFGDVAENLAIQLDAGHRIMDMGHCPIVPLLLHYMHIHRRRPHPEWIAADKKLVSKSDILLRLAGEAPGADIEVEHAVSCNIPVVYNWDELTAKLLEMGNK